MTAHAIQGYREKCLQGGMDGYISKPIQMDHVRKTIEETLSNVAKLRESNPLVQLYESQNSPDVTPQTLPTTPKVPSEGKQPANFSMINVNPNPAKMKAEKPPGVHIDNLPALTPLSSATIKTIAEGMKAFAEDNHLEES
jgi:DNA-binding NarL/FixJ family response regulator